MTVPNHIDNEQLLAYAAGDLSGEAAVEVETHLARTPVAARTVALYRMAAARIAADDSVAPPRETIERARGIFRSPARTPEPTLSERVAAVLARLMFDSRLEAVAVRDGETDTRFQLGFETDDAEIDLQAERITPRNGPGTSDRWRLIGQYAADAGASDLEVTMTVAGGGDAPVARTLADDRGVFTIEIAPGRYDLRLTRPDTEVVLSGIEIG